MLTVLSYAQGNNSIARFLEGSQDVSQPDTVRAPYVGMVDLDKIIFRLRDDSGEMKVRIGGGAEEGMAKLRSLDIRRGDTLTVVGYRSSKKRIQKKDAQMVSAIILAKADAPDHGDQTCPPFFLDVKPTFQGRQVDYFAQWVNERLVYPESSRSVESEGKVLMSFIVDKDGQLRDIKVKETSGDYALDGEAYRVVSSSPAWSPGMIKGEPVKVLYFFPVIFKLKEARR